jgi:hypothetical protein
MDLNTKYDSYEVNEVKDIVLPHLLFSEVPFPLEDYQHFWEKQRT